MLVLSLAAHLAVILSFTVGLIPLRQTPPREVYHVDLVNLPVKDPQAGRPDARPTETKKPEPPQPALPKPVPPAPKVEAKPAPKPAPKPAQKPAVPVKPKAKPAEKKTAAPAAQSDPLKAIEEMRKRQELDKAIEDLKQKADRLSQSDTRNSVASQAPVGMPTGKGTEAGPDHQAWISKHVKAGWTLSRHQVSRLDLVAVVRLQFDARGNLRHFEFEEKTMDAPFNNSIEQAIRQLPKLPNTSGPLTLTVIFNLEDLME
ncbi:energy transduction protein TonB [Desulfuromonas sp. AOP6]|nr:energy transduction protein TonB [Desulfuromonas sp. AOP6]